jgi:hypothetical protein
MLACFSGVGGTVFEPRNGETDRSAPSGCARKTAPVGNGEPTIVRVPRLRTGNNRIVLARRLKSRSPWAARSGRPDDPEAKSGASSFLTVERGTPVVDRFGRRAGAVTRVLQHGDGSFDGIVVDTRAGRRFVDAPEVRRIARGAIALGITRADLEEPDPNAMGRAGVPAAGYASDEITEADRDAAITALKRAYVRGELTMEDLGDRVASAHIADAPEQLDAVISDLEPDT